MVILSEVLETSSPSSIYDHKYDVFLSFRGVDTRLNFTDHLYHALVDANLTTFLDDEEIETGLNLKPELESAIKASRASVIVLSQNYASSTWCLEELVLILEQHKNSNQIVIPIFYHVEPTDIRKQKNSFGDAMAKHRHRMEAETNTVKRSQLGQKMEIWKEALTQVANLKGEDARGRPETEFINEIVKDIYHILQVPLRSPVLPLLIGMDNSIQFVTSWLKDGSEHTADILTIYGMGGIGKTSLAKLVHGLFCRAFSRSNFIENISRRCAEQFNGLLDVQKQLCNGIANISSIQKQVHEVSAYTSMIENAVARKKVFLVLDDIDSLKLLDSLLGNKGFHPGSKIIITTKDASLTESCALFKTKFKPKHTKCSLEGLDETASQNLLCLHAFMCNHPKKGYEDVSRKLVKYCDGHPLALEVLGKSLHNRGVDEWEDHIERLKKEPDFHIEKVLQMSFDSLPSENDKELFKHIACFFVGKDRDLTETILKACGIKTISGIRILIDRCLVSIGRNNTLMMHQLVQEMGRDVVRQESPKKPWKRSRLWSDNESFNVLKQKKGKGNVLGLALDMKILENEKLRVSYELNTDALCKMDNLMLLQMNYVQINGCYENFPQELRWLCMHGFPLKWIPSDLPMETLVALDMSYSNIESFDMSCSNSQRPRKRQKLIGSCSKDKRLLGSLKILQLISCEKLLSLGGFVELPALERLIVRNCIALSEVCESIDQCVELVLIDLSYCNKLEKLPTTLGNLKKVKTLKLNGCDLHKFQIKMRNMDLLKAQNIGKDSQTSSSAIMESIPSDLKFFAISLPSSLVSLSLANNNLSNESFPINFSCLSILKALYLDGNPIVSMPNGVRTLPTLAALSMNNCRMLTSIEHPPRTITQLSLYCHNDPCYDDRLLRKIVFDPEMSPLVLKVDSVMFVPSSFEIEGIVKIQPMGGVEEKVLRNLCWTNLEFIKNMHMNARVYGRTKRSQVQMYYEFGIFSTICWGEEMPNWIRHRSVGPSISFTIPSSPNNLLRGLNFSYVHILQFPKLHGCVCLPVVRISNITRNCTWIYKHYITDVSADGKCFTFLSHWMFGNNEMEGGDQVTVSIIASELERCQCTTECGVSFVYDDGNMEEEDALGYYKSWNHIIGGDLSSFQTTTREYMLDHMRFVIGGTKVISHYPSIFANDLTYEEEEVSFRAFSRRKSDMLGGEDVTTK